MLWQTHILFQLLYQLYTIYKSANVIGYFNPEWENELGVIYVFDHTNPEVQKYITHVFTDNKKRG